MSVAKTNAAKKTEKTAEQIDAESREEHRRAIAQRIVALIAALSAQSSAIPEGHVRAVEREAAEFAFWKRLWIGCKRVPFFTAMDEQNLDMDAKVTACWGSYDRSEPFAEPFDGQPVPSFAQIVMPLSAMPKAAATAEEKPSPEAQLRIDFLKSNYEGWERLPTLKDYSFEWTEKGKTFRFFRPAGTVLGTCSNKELARLLYAAGLDVKTKPGVKRSPNLVVASLLGVPPKPLMATPTSDTDNGGNVVNV